MGGVWASPCNQAAIAISKNSEPVVVDAMLPGRPRPPGVMERRSLPLSRCCRLRLVLVLLGWR